MGKSPAFQLYASDFDMDTASWDNEEVGIYFRLLMYQWVNGSVPVDTKRLSKVARMGQKRFEKRWQIISKKFQENGNNELINIRMESVRQEQDNYRKSQQEAGKRGVEKKKKLGLFPFNKSSDPLSNPSSDPATRNQALQSSPSSSPSSLKETQEMPFLKDNKHFEKQVGDFFDSIKSNCEAILKLPSKGGRPFNPFEWVQTNVNKKKHPGAIEESLGGLIKYWNEIDSPYGYAESILKTKNPNWVEKDNITKSKANWAVVQKKMIEMLKGFEVGGDKK